MYLYNVRHVRCSKKTHTHTVNVKLNSMDFKANNHLKDRDKKREKEMKCTHTNTQIFNIYSMLL